MSLLRQFINFYKFVFYFKNSFFVIDNEQFLILSYKFSLNFLILSLNYSKVKDHLCKVDDISDFSTVSAIPSRI